MKFNKANRLVHRWATVVVTLPLLVILLSGILLQWKKQAAWIQPATQQGTSTSPTLGFPEILEIAREVEVAAINSWEDIDRLDVRPDAGIIKVHAVNRWEIQLDAATGDVLQVALRRSDLIESLHDGSFFHRHAKLWVFFPSAIALVLMLGTGVYMFVLPSLSRARRRKQNQAG